MILLYVEFEGGRTPDSYVARRAAFDEYRACGMAVKKQPRCDATAIQRSSWSVYCSHTKLGQLFYRQQLDPLFQLRPRHTK